MLTALTCGYRRCAVLLPAVADGTPAGAGIATDPEGGLTQVAGIAVLPSHRVVASPRPCALS